MRLWYFIGWVLEVIVIKIYSFIFYSLIYLSLAFRTFTPFLLILRFLYRILIRTTGSKPRRIGMFSLLRITNLYEWVFMRFIILTFLTEIKILTFPTLITNTHYRNSRTAITSYILMNRLFLRFTKSLNQSTNLRQQFSNQLTKLLFTFGQNLIPLRYVSSLRIQ